MQMLANSKLYKETLVRVGPDEMRGVNRLITNKHYGIAERHTVNKLIGYIRDLEKQMGIKVPKSKDFNEDQHFIKIIENGRIRYVIRE